MTMIPDPVDDVQRKLASNERIKLSAGALSSLANAMGTLGVLGPLAAFIYAPAGFAPGRPTRVLVLSAASWAIIGGALHYGARRLLRGLMP